MKQIIFKIIVLVLALLGFLGLPENDKDNFKTSDSTPQPLTTPITKN